MQTGLNRVLIVIHRWMGIILGLVMLMWCLTGFVMMYTAYPSLDEDSRLAALAPLDGQSPVVRGVLPQSIIGRFQVEMMGDRSIVRVDGEGPRPTDLDLLAVARRFDRRATLLDSKMERDQWTVSGDVRGPPFAKYALNDGKGTWLYVSTKTGRAVQKVDTAQRVLSWLGPIPHWLYPKVLRQNGQLWSQVVIWLSATGTFMTVVGIYVGIVRIKKGKLSPFRGWHLWHHVGGLVAGLLVLTWVFSGLLSMNPWGLLEVKDEGESAKLSRFTMAWADAGPTINRVLANPAAAGAVSLRSSIFDQSLYVIASKKDGSQVRLDLDGNPAPFTARDRERVGVLLGGKIDILTHADAYYYGHGSETVRLPVIRVTTPGKVRYYVDDRSGALISKIDSGGRGYRWWMQGLHRLDFFGWLRWRPVWDILMIALLSGATLVCATGVWMGWRHIRLLIARR
jgi:uncharacterized iron-regulated membrane protein